MKFILKKILLILQIVFALGLLSTYIPGILSPSKNSLIASLSLLYPYLLAVNLLFCLFWIILLKRYFLLSLLCILIRVDYIPLYFQLNTNKKEIEGKETGLLSYNVHLFRFKREQFEPAYLNTFNALVEERNTSVVCLQEFPSSTVNQREIIQKIKKECGLQYHFGKKNKKGDIRNNIIFSKYPFVHTGSVFSNSTDSLLNEYRFIYADIRINKDTFRVYNVHFASFHLDEKDKLAYEQLLTQKELKKPEGMRIFNKLRKTMLLHEKETRLLLSHMKESPYRTILCGDFNDTPASFLYQKVRRLMKDSFVEAGRGTGNTYNGFFPAYRIDYILFNKSLQCSHFEVIKTPISDHFPIFARLLLEEEIPKPS